MALTDEEKAGIIAAGGDPDEIEEISGEEIDLIAELVATEGIISQERYEHLLERVTECQNRLDSLSTTLQAENPIFSQLINQMVEMRAELLALKSSTESMSRQLSSLEPQPQSQNQPQTPATVESPAEPSPEPSTVEPSVEAHVAPVRKNRVRRL